MPQVMCRKVRQQNWLPMLLLCEKETNLKVIQSVMGHKDIQTTMDIYAEATEEKKQESFERLAATLDIF